MAILLLIEANAAENIEAGRSTKTPEEFLFDLGHAHILLGDIVGERKERRKPTKYFLSTAPVEATLEQMVFVTKMHWRIERA